MYVTASLAALAIPAILALTAVLLPRRAPLATSASAILALVFAAGVLAGMPSRLGVRADVATCVMLLLVAALGLVIGRFSRTYLQGDRGLPRYQRWFLFTLAAVTALVVANDLLVIALAWTATSIALHQLLTFYPDRPEALVAAHKKFLVSRLADACVFACLALVQAEVGSLDLDRIASWVAARPSLSWSMEVAAVLLVVAVALRSAQLPFHGWLAQVMEAPTPVSALLHAGVVNIGGFVLIRLAPWIAQAEAARLVLVAVGLVSAVVAALVMTTRISVKVALAWSTCAQMGFLLVQCGLGLWPLALLHLVAHSLYKAHAFLAAGTAVEEWKQGARTSAPPAVSPLRVAVTAAVGIAAALAGVVLLGGTLGMPALVLALLVGLSTSPLALSRTTVAGVARLAFVVSLYLGWHALAEQTIAASPAPMLAWLLVAIGLAALFTVSAVLRTAPRSAFARALHPWLFAGLYLDELFTRITFRLWPPRRIERARAPAPPPVPAVSEVAA